LAEISPIDFPRYTRARHAAFHLTFLLSSLQDHAGWAHGIQAIDGLRQDISPVDLLQFTEDDQHVLAKGLLDEIKRGNCTPESIRGLNPLIN
jgi:hypothetical protein